MEKNIFLSDLKDKLTEMNLSDETIQRHIKVFDDCLSEMPEEEIDKLIEGAGGIEGILKSVYNIENSGTDKKHTENHTQDNIIKNTPEPTSRTIEDRSPETPQVASKPNNLLDGDLDSNNITLEINRSPDIDKHIREAEEITTELEKTTINKVPALTRDDVEYATDISDYDFDALFSQKTSKPELWLKYLRSKMTDKVYKYTLPVSVLAAFILFLAVSALFPLLIASAVTVWIAYIFILIFGICFSIIPVGYGIYMCFDSIPIALYELGIGITVLGITMLVSILLYNYAKRLVPFLFIKIKKLFKYCIKLVKTFFTPNVKEDV